MVGHYSIDPRGSQENIEWGLAMGLYCYQEKIVDAIFYAHWENVYKQPMWIKILGITMELWTYGHIFQDRIGYGYLFINGPHLPVF